MDTGDGKTENGNGYLGIIVETVTKKNLGICWVIDQKRGNPLSFFKRQMGFWCQHRPPHRQPKRGTCDKGHHHRWGKTLPATMANNKPKTPSGSSFCIWSKWTRTWPCRVQHCKLDDTSLWIKFPIISGWLCDKFLSIPQI